MKQRTVLLPQVKANTPAARIAPLADMLNAFDFEDAARVRLDPVLFAALAGGDRSALERITFRPRMMVNTMGFDMTSELFGAKLFAPIFLGPVANLKRFHPEGEVAMARGASAAKAPFVLSAESSFPVKDVAAVATSPWWYQVYADAAPAAAKDKIAEATGAGAKALVITATGVARNWAAIDALRKAVTVPVVLKGVMTPAEAKAALDQGIQGMIVSHPGRQPSPSTAVPSTAVPSTVVPSTIEALAPVLDTVGGRVPVLVDGAFRRGSDILKGLATGASAVLLGRPSVWALTAYGSDGVQFLFEYLQTDVARDMCMAGKVNLKALDRTLLKVHKA